MYEYVLFLDTETSSMPKRWNAPTAKVEEWPYILQIGWVLCKKSGEEVFSRDFYVKQTNIEIDKEAEKLHGITLEMLQEKGVERKVVLNSLASDLEVYKPLIVGHFLEFDKKMMEVGFTRAQIVQNFDRLPKFCTMLYTRSNRDIFGGYKFMRLDELYESLFNRKLDNFHNALADARATKDCFMELVKQGKVTDHTISLQDKMVRRQWELPIWMVVLLTILAVAIMAAVLLVFID